MNKSLLYRSMYLGLITLALSACSNDSSDSNTVVNTDEDTHAMDMSDEDTMPMEEEPPAPEVILAYEVNITNLTANQPFSPPAMLLHDQDYRAWQLGDAASTALEQLAEGGDNSGLIALNGNGELSASFSADAPVGPGANASYTISAAENTPLMMTFVTMLVNTNDAFAGVSAWDLSQLAVGDELQTLLPVYDAGTEANDELAGSIPGPADGGEGFNSLRSDVNYVARHPGVVSRDNGYNESILNASHRFDAPAAKLVVRRTQ